jgi:aspartyl-tRNA(Asn)/glutamyl-tRNA(Gln) amidotransferase subunit A
MQLCDLSAVEIRKAITEKKASAVEVLESCLERIRQVDGRPGTIDSGPETELDREKVHAFITLTEDSAREQAQSVDKMVAAGEDPGPLAGIPATIKDVFCVKGTPSTIGSRILENFNSPYSATSVERMQSAGAVLLGKVNLDEFTYGSSTESSAFQPSTRNPWDTSRVPGGSSGGSTASVAAGEAPLSLGTDTAGSVRQPAAFCGVVGLKPTYGRVSRYGLIAFGSSLDCPGPVGRNAKDTALLLRTIAGPDKRDATGANLPVPDYLALLEKEIKGKRIGLSPDYFQITFPNLETGEYTQQSIPSEIMEATMKTAEVYRALGAEIIEDVPMPNTRYGIPVYFVISRVEAASNLHRFDGIKYGYRSQGEINDLKSLYRKSRGEGFGTQPKLRILMGMYVSAAQYSERYYHKALQVRTLIRRDFEQAFDPQGKYKLDAMLTPTTPTTAFPMKDVYGNSVLMQYADQLTVPANHAGVPGISFPAGLDSSGLPIGVQLLGPDFSEGTLLQLTHAYEKATVGEDWRTQRPAVLREI